MTRHLSPQEARMATSRHPVYCHCVPCMLRKADSYAELAVTASRRGRVDAAATYARMAYHLTHLYHDKLQRLNAVLAEEFGMAAA